MTVKNINTKDRVLKVLISHKSDCFCFITRKERGDSISISFLRRFPALPRCECICIFNPLTPESD